MSTVTTKKNRSKKPKLDHEPVRAMAETPRKIFQDACRKAARRRVKNVPPKEKVMPVPKKPEKKCPPPAAGNDVDAHPLVPYPLSPPTEEEVQALETLLTSVSPSTTPVTQTDPPMEPPPPRQALPPVPVPQEVMCPFHPTSELQRRISAKGWDYIKCMEEEKCPYWVPTAEAAVISEMTRKRLDAEIAGGPWMCYCWEASCVRLASKNPKSPNLGRPYLSCSQKPKCEFFQWADEPWNPYVREIRARLKQLPVIHSVWPAPENEWRKVDRPLGEGDPPLSPQPLLIDQGPSTRAELMAMMEEPPTPLENEMFQPSQPFEREKDIRELFPPLFEELSDTCVPSYFVNS